MTDMIKRVAIAIGKAEKGDDWLQGNHWNMNAPNRERLFGIARAAILAMREPTEGMWLGASPVILSAIDTLTWAAKEEAVNVDARALWSGMIDAALGEDSDGL